MASLWSKLGAQINPFDHGRTFKNPVGAPRVDPNAVREAMEMRRLQQQARANPAQRNAIAAQIAAIGTNTTPTWKQVTAPSNPIEAAGQGVVNKLMNRRVAPVALGIGRSGLGTLEGLSGLVDLASPGKGTNRVTKALQGRSKQADETMKREAYNNLAYKAAQLGGDVATFYATGAPLLKGVTKGAAVASKVPVALRAGEVLDNLAQLGKAGKISAAGLRYLSRPDVLANIVSDTAIGAGQRSAKGKDVSVASTLLDAGLSVGTGLGAGAVGYGIKKGAQPGVKALKNAKLIKPANLSPDEVGKLAAFQGQRRTGAIGDDQLYYEARDIAKKAGVDFNDSRGIDRLVQDFQTYDIRKGQRDQFLRERGSIGLAMRAVDDQGNPVSSFTGQPFGAKKLGPTRTGFPDESKLNTQRLNLNDSQRQQLGDETIEVINKLSNKDVERAAKSAGLDTRTHTIEQTKEIIAKQLNVRKDAVRLMNEARSATKASDKERLILQAAEQGRTSRSQGTDVARQLQARKIIANELDSPEQRIFKLLDEAGVNPEVYAKRLSEVDFDNPKDVVKAYRELVPAKAKNWLDTLRYNSMLSSPLTHLTNTLGNALNVGVVAPVEKTLRGIFSKNYAAGEGAAYSKGVVTNIAKARDNFIDAMKGFTTENLDLNEYSTPLAVGGVKGAAYNTLSAPMRLLGASDKFFRTLAEAGEMGALAKRESKGIRIKGNKTALAQAEGAYRLFQQDTGNKGQGFILQGIDGITDSIMQARRKVPAMKWVLPFVKTPTNIAKQGVEFSPLGFANAINAEDKATAITRAAIGTAVFGSAATMLGGGDVTWGEPTNAEQKAAFRAEGKQPYAVKIGDKWISFTKLPPGIAFPFALTAGINDAVNTKKMSESDGEAVMEGVAKWGQFLSDQSYLKSVGDTLGMFKGDMDKTAQALANYPQQLVPFRALTGWLARLSDSKDRKINRDKGWIDSQVQSLMQQYPGLRQQTEAREDPFTGGELAANNQVFNAFSPIRVTQDKGFGNTAGLTVDQREQMRDLPEADRATFRQGINETKSAKSDLAMEKKGIKGGSTQLSNGKFYTKIGDEYKTFDSKEKSDLEVAKYNFKKTNKNIETYGDFVLRRAKDGSVTTMPKLDYDYSINTNKLQSLKKKQDVGSWLEVANSQLDILRKQWQNPTLDELERSEIEEKGNNLLEQMEKYQGYGGFTKGKSTASRLPSLSVGKPQSFSVKGVQSAKSAKRKGYNILASGKATKKVKVKI